MKVPRQKLLVIVSSLVIGGTILYGVVNAAILAPAKALDDQARLLEDQIRKANQELPREPQVARSLSDLYHRTFGTDEADVSEEMRARLMGLLAPSGLSAEQFSSLPVNSGAQLAKSRDRVVSRTITIRGGKFDRAINLLYLLAAEPHLHRIDTLNLKPASERGKVDLTFRYSTLAMDLPKGQRPATSSAPAEVETASLDGEDRELYRIIEERDILRPYVKRPPPEVVRPPDAPRAPDPAPPPPPPGRGEPEEARWRIAGLPTVFGADLVFTRHVQSGETRTYKIGQTLMDGKIVMVDSRSVPRYDDPKVFSDSRVILQMKDTFWAVELGDALIQKHRLSPAQLPPALRTPTTTSAEGPGGGKM